MLGTLTLLIQVLERCSSTVTDIRKLPSTPLLPSLSSDLCMASTTPPPHYAYSTFLASQSAQTITHAPHPTSFRSSKVVIARHGVIADLPHDIAYTPESAATERDSSPKGDQLLVQPILQEVVWFSCSQ